MEDVPTQSVAPDVTSRVESHLERRATATPAPSDELFRSVYESMAQGVVFQDAEGQIIAANPAAERILGLSLDQMQGRTSADPRWRAIHEDGSAFPGDEHPAMVALHGGRPVHGVRMGVYHPATDSMHWLLVDGVPQFRPGEESPYQVYAVFTDVTEQLAAETALRESEDRFKYVFDRSAIGKIIRSPRGQVTAVNDALCRMLGYTHEELMGSEAAAIMLPEDAATAREVAAAMLAGLRDEDSMRLRFLAKDGSVRWGDVTLALRRDADGAPQYFIASVVDVTEQVAATEEVARLNAMRDVAEQAALMGSWSWDLENRRLIRSRGVDRLLDLEDADADAETILLQRVHPEDRERLPDLVARCRRQGGELNVEYRVVHRDGGEHILRATGTVEPALPGRMARVTGVLRDVTAERRAEAAAAAAARRLAESEATLRAILQNAAEGMSMLDLQSGRYVFMSQRLLELTGYTVQEMTDLSAEAAFDLCHQDDRQMPVEQQRRLAAGEADVGAVEYRWRVKSGEYRWFRDSRSVLRDANGTPYALVGVCSDISEQKQTEAELRESREEYRLLAENASDVVFRASVEGVFEWMSASVTALVGWLPEELVGRSFAEIVHPDDLPASQATVGSVRQGCAVALEARLRTRTGAYRWISVSVRPLFKEAGAVTAVAGGWRDIQAEVEARTALAASQAQLRATLDGLVDPHVVLRAVCDEAGSVIDFVYADANPAACAYNHLSREALIGARLLAVLPGDLASEVLAQCTVVLQTGEPLVADDVLHAVEFQGRVERRFDIRAVCIGADMLSYTWRDVTERHQAEEVVRRRVAELAALQRLSELLVQSIDLTPVLDSACRLLEEVLAADHAEVRFLPSELVSDREQTMTAVVDAALVEGRPRTVATQEGGQVLAVPLLAHTEALGVLLLTRVPGSEGFGAGSQSLAQTAGDMLAAVIWIDRLHAEQTEEAAASERQRIARDLHDAVTQSIYAATMLAESLPVIYEQDPALGREHLATIRRLMRAAFAELRILLYELRPETLATAPLDAVFERLRDALAGRGDIDVELQVDTDLNLAQDVRTTFYRVAQEALNNVGKYAHASQVQVRLGREGDGVRLMVHDDGRGFDAAEAPAGMGLDIMRERAAAIGAELGVTSSLIEGTTISMAWRPGSGRSRSSAT